MINEATRLQKPATVVEHANANAEWIAAMSPAVAEPLAAWLDVELDRVECGYRTDALPHALAFARSILGGSDA